MRLLCYILLCFLVSLAMNKQPDVETLGDLGVLHCGPSGFQFTIHLGSQETGSFPALVAWDNEGLLHTLQNDSDCGTWVGEGPDHSVVLEVNYSSCYATELEFHHVMLVGVEQVNTVGHDLPTKKQLLRCPVDLRALDAPGVGLCNSIPVQDRLPCSASPVSQRDCEELGCCYSSEGDSCYYGNTVTSHCTQEGHFSIAVSRNVSSPPLRLDSVHLASGNDSSCDPVIATPAFVLFRFPFTACGTTSQITGGQAIYENELLAMRDVRTWSHGSITRDSIFRLRVSCSYSISSNELPVDMEVLTLPPPLPETQSGPLTVVLQIAKDKDYGSYYMAGDYPVVKLLREPIYVDVAILYRTDPHLGLRLHQCWATPRINPVYQPQWPILVKGCPYTGDNYQTQLIPVQKAVDLPFPSHHQRFSISTFSFVDNTVAKEALKGPVYLHCSVSVCQPVGTPACMATCPIDSRRSSVYFENSTASISSQGPMILLQATTDAAERLHKYSGAAVQAEALWVAGLSATLVIGALLVSYLAIKTRR
ncbi:zona pellucida sperm-binding protein 4 [Ochotona curzoniae]|uniref:zona pellucida sperm-binding protein 4 n=1 Tax=Ochotona curzoniae TaxID=130825 RepID=UPI001B34AD9B|nr:zona pellucida sperm-binding protein 4 [Ochotona curzoniae]